jgi:hypothetical protein
MSLVVAQYHEGHTRDASPIRLIAWDARYPRSFRREVFEGRYYETSADHQSGRSPPFKLYEVTLIQLQLVTADVAFLESFCLIG